MRVDISSGVNLQAIGYYNLGQFNLSRFAQYLFDLEQPPRLVIEEIDLIERAVRRLPDIQYYTLQLSWRGNGSVEKFNSIPDSAIRKMRLWERAAKERLKHELMRLGRALHAREEKRSHVQEHCGELSAAFSAAAGREAG